MSNALLDELATISLLLKNISIHLDFFENNQLNELTNSLA